MDRVKPEKETPCLSVSVRECVRVLSCLSMSGWAVGGLPCVCRSLGVRVRTRLPSHFSSRGRVCSVEQVPMCGCVSPSLGGRVAACDCVCLGCTLLVLGGLSGDLLVCTAQQEAGGAPRPCPGLPAVPRGSCPPGPSPIQGLEWPQRTLHRLTRWPAREDPQAA